MKQAPLAATVLFGSNNAFYAFYYNPIAWDGLFFE
jgi:hypothetical protein